MSGFRGTVKAIGSIDGTSPTVWIKFDRKQPNGRKHPFKTDSTGSAPFSYDTDMVPQSALDRLAEL